MSNRVHNRRRLGTFSLKGFLMSKYLKVTATITRLAFVNSCPRHQSIILWTDTSLHRRTDCSQSIVRFTFSGISNEWIGLRKPQATKLNLKLDLFSIYCEEHGFASQR